jgi:hypothetical protein
MDQLFTRILDEIDKTSSRVAIAPAITHLVQNPVVDEKPSIEEQHG